MVMVAPLVPVVHAVAALTFLGWWLLGGAGVFNAAYAHSRYQGLQVVEAKGFGARAGATVLSRATTVCAILFVVLVGIAFITRGQSGRQLLPRRLVLTHAAPLSRSCSALTPLGIPPL